MSPISQSRLVLAANADVVRREAPVLQHFQSQMPHGLFVPDAQSSI
jgi:hypothetical protein